ncbi:MAG: hypothetical protein IPP10_10405 [Candidatus Competibacteraceae bacterium]|nr:hypothetical protein [Candidatus Competibacteraceae bacterium]
MKNDSIVDEVRNNGLALVAQCNNDIEAIFKALREREHRRVGLSIMSRTDCQQTAMQRK